MSWIYLDSKAVYDNVDSSVTSIGQQDDDATTVKDKAKKVTSLPAIATHQVKFESRAGYKDLGVALKDRQNAHSRSLGKLELRFLKNALKRRNVKKVVTLEPEAGVTPALTWTGFRVCEWIRQLGYPHYVPCFKENFIDGRKLIHFREIQNFPKIGITDFGDMKKISDAICDLLQVTKPVMYPYMTYYGHRSISWPSEEMYEMYIQDKSKTGTKIDSIKFELFKEMYPKMHDRAWDLPNCNRKWRKHKAI